jgi:hypothetical protein
LYREQLEVLINGENVSAKRLLQKEHDKCTSLHKQLTEERKSRRREADKFKQLLAEMTRTTELDKMHAKEEMSRARQIDEKLTEAKMELRAMEASATRKEHQWHEDKLEFKQQLDNDVRRYKDKVMVMERTLHEKQQTADQLIAEAALFETKVKDRLQVQKSELERRLENELNTARAECERLIAHNNKVSRCECVHGCMCVSILFYSFFYLWYTQEHESKINRLHSESSHVQSVIDERDGVVKRLQRELNERDTDLRKSHVPIPEVIHIISMAIPIPCVWLPLLFLHWWCSVYECN